jgi:OOP family OmpA-OmpF porin
MTSIKRAALAAIAATALPFAAHAAGDIYVGAGIGQAEYKSSEFVADFCPSDTCDQFKDSDFAYNLFVGYQVTDAVAVELGYQDWGKGKDDDFYGESVTVEPSMITAMAVGTAPINDSFSLFGKLGIAFLSIKGTDVTDNHSETADSQDLALGGGVQWSSGPFGVRLETLWVDAEDADKALMWGVSGLYKFAL